MNDIDQINVLRKPDVFEPVSKHDLVQFKREGSNDWITLSGEELSFLMTVFKGERGFVVHYTKEGNYTPTEVCVAYQKGTCDGEALSMVPLYDRMMKEWFSERV